MSQESASTEAYSLTEHVNTAQQRKRPRIESDSESIATTVAMADADGDIEEGREERGAIDPLGQRGRPLFGIGRHHFTQKKTYTFAKHFYFKIYANDWKRFGPGTENGSVKLAGFMSVIPWSALCMYISPDEYLEMVRSCNYAKIKETKFDLNFKSVRTPFDANSTDVAEANGNLNFQLCRWDNLEMMLPFAVGDIPYASDATQPRFYKTNAELINRLYGVSLLNLPENPENQRLPATMRERGLDERPIWSFHGGAGAHNGPETATGVEIDVQRYIASLPVGQYVTDCVNTNLVKNSPDGYSFTKVYRPKNGLITFAPSGFNPFNADLPQGLTFINHKTRMGDNRASTNPLVIQSNFNAQYIASAPTVNIAKTLAPDDPEANFIDDHSSAETWIINGPNPNYVKAPVTIDQDPTVHRNLGEVFPYENKNDNTPANKWKLLRDVTPEVFPDQTGFGYQADMFSYTTAYIENYQMYTSRNDPPIHHLPSMLIGAIPKTNRDNTIVNATFEFECRTQITIEAQEKHNVYMNMATQLVSNDDVASGTGVQQGEPLDPNFNDTRNYMQYRWQTNEVDVCLADNKYWNKSYGLAGKPQFEPYPYSWLLMSGSNSPLKTVVKKEKKKPYVKPKK